MRPLLRPLLAVAATATLVLAGCGASDDGEDVIRIAHIAPTTGPASAYGKGVVSSMKYAVDEVNKDGGLEVAGKKYQVEVTVYDDKQTAETAQSVARKALDDGHEFIVGPFGSGPTSAIQSVMASNPEAFFFLPVASVVGPTQNPNVYRTGALAGRYTDIFLEWLEKHPEVKTVGMITDQLHTGLLAEQKRLVQGIEDLGRTVTMQQKMQLGDTDFRAALTKMLDDEPDLYMLRTYPAETVLLTKQLRELGGTTPLSWAAGMTSTEAKTLVGDETMLKDVTQATPLANIDPWLAAKDPLAQKLDDGLDNKAGSFAVAAYDGAQILFEGFRTSDEVSPEALQKAMDALTAEDIADVTIQDFKPWDDGKLFKDREVNVGGSVVEWQAGTGFVIAD
jgi:branched-chain amino acid transport system substrate-binding protein